jgi:hypothetical protein
MVEFLVAVQTRLHFPSLCVLSSRGNKLATKVLAEGKAVTYDLKPDRNDPTAVGTSEMADAIIAHLKKSA